MANLLYLPFDIHVLIVRNLDLRSCLSYTQIATVCHDAVYYIFAHRSELDFSSLIVDNTWVHYLTLYFSKSFILIREPPGYGTLLFQSHLLHSVNYHNTSIYIGHWPLFLNMIQVYPALTRPVVDTLDIHKGSSSLSTI